MLLDFFYVLNLTMELFYLLIPYFFTSLVATQHITCTDNLMRPSPSVHACVELVAQVEHEGWPHLDLTFGSQRRGYAAVPNCYTVRDCQLCLITSPGERREDQFSWYSYIGSMEATIAKCIRPGHSGGYFPAGRRNIFRFIIYGTPPAEPRLGEVSNATTVVGTIVGEPNLLQTGTPLNKTHNRLQDPLLGDTVAA